MTTTYNPRVIALSDLDMLVTDLERTVVAMQALWTDAFRDEHTFNADKIRDEAGSRIDDIVSAVRRYTQADQ